MITYTIKNYDDEIFYSPEEVWNFIVKDIYDDYEETFWRDNFREWVDENYDSITILGTEFFPYDILKNSGDLAYFLDMYIDTELEFAKENFIEELQNEGVAEFRCYIAIRDDGKSNWDTMED